MASGPFTLAQLARAAGMKLDDVRLYMDCGLPPPPRRRRSRSDDIAVQAEHLERLEFIQRALACGFKLDDVAEFVRPVGLMTCGDVYAITSRRLEHMRRSETDMAAAACLARLRDSCAQVGPRKDCKILEALSRSDCWDPG